MLVIIESSYSEKNIVFFFHFSIKANHLSENKSWSFQPIFATRQLEKVGHETATEYNLGCNTFIENGKTLYG